MEIVVTSIVGVFLGGAIAYTIAKRVAHRPKLKVRLDETMVLRPADLNLHNNLTLSVNGAQVENLCSLALTVECSGSRDIVVPDAAPPRGENATPPPRLDFDGFEIIGVRTLNNDNSRCYIPLGIRTNRRGLYVNVHRIRKSTTARFSIIGVLDPGVDSIDQCRFFPGAITDVDVLTFGAIARPWETS